MEYFEKLYRALDPQAAEPQRQVWIEPKLEIKWTGSEMRWVRITQDGNGRA